MSGTSDFGALPFYFKLFELLSGYMTVCIIYFLVLPSWPESNFCIQFLFFLLFLQASLVCF